MSELTLRNGKTMSAYTVTKTYPHSLGLSCVYRQWRADSHCQQLHGYALEVAIEFGADILVNGWVIDFGGLKPIKDTLVEWFDHTTIVTPDDPHVGHFSTLAALGVINMQLHRHVGCEAFAKAIYNFVHDWIKTGSNADRVTVLSVTVREHEGNAATYRA